MRSVLSTVVFMACVPVCLAGGIVLLAGIGIGWCAVQLSPHRRGLEDSFEVPPVPHMRSVR